MVVQIGIVPIGSYIWMLNHQGVVVLRIRRYGLVRIDVTFFGGNVPLRVGFGVSKAQARPSGSLFLLPVDPDIELSANSPTPHLPEYHHSPRHNDNGLNL